MNSPPKFKKGDMVQVASINSISNIPPGCWLHNINCAAAGVIGTVTLIEAFDAFIGYHLDSCCRKCKHPVSALEPCLRLIRDGDLKLDDAPAELTQDNLLKVAKWLEESLK